VARRTKLWTATHERDAGKTFLITEMSADRAERWAIRMVLAVVNAGVKVPEGSLQAGMSGIAAILATGVRSLAGLKFEAISELLDEMLTCVQYQPAPNLPPQPLWTGDNCQIEEVRTRLALRMEVLELHLGFSLAALASNTPETSAPTADAA
jgi:hypothetical protein